MLNSPLGGRRGIGFGLGRSWQRKAAGGWWDLDGTLDSCKVAYQAKGAASYAASKVNLAGDVAYNAVDFGTPAWDDVSGWDFTTSNSAIDSNYKIPNLGAVTIFMRFSDADLTEVKNCFGIRNSPEMRVWLHYTAGKIRIAYGNEESTNWESSSGVYALGANISRFEYLNGNLWQDIIEPVGNQNYSMIIGAANLNNEPYNHSKLKIQAFSIYNEGLSLTVLDELRTRVNAL